MENRFVLGLVTGIIRNRGVAQIDANKLRRDSAPATGLPNAEDHIGAHFLCRIYDDFCGFAENHGNKAFYQRISTDFLR